MDFDERRQLALALLQERGITAARAEPPVVRLARRLGLRLRPVHFEPFWRTAFIQGISFTLVYGVFMWVTQWGWQGRSAAFALTSAGLTGALFGLCFAGWFAWQCRKHGLPSWEELGQDGRPQQ